MIKKPAVTFHFVFEILIWLIYVGIYKYSYYLDQIRLPYTTHTYFPYLEICLYSICSTLFLIPYYRWAVPYLLQRKKYLLLVLVSIGWFVFAGHFNNKIIAWIFAQFSQGLVVQQFFLKTGMFTELNLILTDFIAFFCTAMARFSYQNEIRRHQTETDHLQLQLNMLKTQLQPHFLFNTLNSLYGLSLTGSKDTPHFILLLSQMMQYILYDCDQEQVTLQEEIDFLKGYFELEQQKFPQADIFLEAPDVDPTIRIPPLLFLPLIENSFKHGRHKLEDNAGVGAELSLSANQIIFRIQNDQLKQPAATGRHGGIGLVNIRKRLELYYPGKYNLSLTTEDDQYIALVTIEIK